MPKFEIKDVPDLVSKEALLLALKPLEQFDVFADKSNIVLTYLGGITNHGLKASDLGLFVRVPGPNSDLFIDRQEELKNMAKLADAGFYPRVLEAYATGALKGYKVEPLIAGETLQFADFHKHQFEVLGLLKSLHDSSIQFERNYDIFEKLNQMCEALQSRGVMALPYLIRDGMQAKPIDEVRAIIDELQYKRDKLCADVELVPCHNDITPTNFIEHAVPVNGQNYQLIDWEYAGMNDPMYDVAGIAAMLGMSLEASADLTLHYFQSADKARHAEEIARVQFYLPIVKLYYAVWATLQVTTGNASSSIEELRSGWGPGSLTVFLEHYTSDAYQALLLDASSTLALSI